MIGIYKITNELNGKSYIGQSIHCGRRLDEHCRGNQLIDEVIQIDGIENFTFQILKEVNQSELSLWEDYYIMKYDTMFPNGYNKKWNCSQEVREQFIQSSSMSEDNTMKTILPTKKKTYTKEEILFALAKEMQEEEYRKDRITTQEQLEKFYQDCEYEKANRKKIGDILNKDVLKNIKGAAKFRAQEIERAIDIYNRGFITKYIDGLDELSSSMDDYNKILSMGVKYFRNKYETYRPDFGLIKNQYDNAYYGLSFGIDTMTLYLRCWNEIAFNTYRKLFQAGFFTTKNVYILDKNDQKVDINERFVWKEQGQLKLVVHVE